MPSAEIDAPCPKCGSGETWASYEDPTAHFCGACRSYFRVIPPGLVPCVCGEQMVKPYPNDTGDHSTTECPIPPDREDADAAE